MNTKLWCGVAFALSFAGSVAAQTAPDQPRSFDTPGSDSTGNWLVDSATLDADEAETEAQIQAASGNCRLIATVGNPPNLIDGGPETAKYGFIIIADTDDSGSADVEAALDTAEAFGEIYNEAIGESCDF